MNRDDWHELLRNCNFEMSAGEVRNMLRMWKEEAASKGEAAYYNPEFLEVLYPFLETPSLDTAVSLLEVAPATYSAFEKCSPGGDSYEMNHFLQRDATVHPEVESEGDFESESERELEELRARLRALEGDATVQGDFTSETGQPSAVASELKAAFVNSARPNAPPPPGWWVLPMLGIIASLFLFWVNTALGAICLVLTSSFFGVSWMRAKRNRPRS